MSNPPGLTREERLAVASLKRLAKRWPPSLWLFSASGSLLVVRTAKDGSKVHTADCSIDSEYIVESIDGIQNDGGDF